LNSRPTHYECDASRPADTKWCPELLLCRASRLAATAQSSRYPGVVSQQVSQQDQAGPEARLTWQRRARGEFPFKAAATASIATVAERRMGSPAVTGPGQRCDKPDQASQRPGQGHGSSFSIVGLNGRPVGHRTSNVHAAGPNGQDARGGIRAHIRVGGSAAPGSPRGRRQGQE
jgi:hypothetical protein